MNSKISYSVCVEIEIQFYRRTREAITRAVASFMSLFTHNELVAILDDLSEGRTPPVPVAVDDKVGRVGDEWSGVCVELARLV